MYLKKALPLFLLLACTLSIDQFKTSRDLINCITICEVPITQCLKSQTSACNNAYQKCHQHQNFLTCIESNNGLLQQEIAKCMRRDCTNISEKNDMQQQRQTNEKGDEFRMFNTVIFDEGLADMVSDQEKVEVERPQQIQIKQNQQKGKSGIRRM